MEVDIVYGLAPEHRSAAAEGFWTAFSGKLSVPLGPDPLAIAFLESVIDPTHAISARNTNGALLGVAGFKTSQGAFVGGTFWDLAKVYGGFGACWRAVLLELLERKLEPNTLLMDGVFVSPDARGQGIGTLLLSAIETRARDLGLSSIRLDVIDENPRARALYETRGFEPVARSEIGVLRHVFKFTAATTMKKQL